MAIHKPITKEDLELILLEMFFRVGLAAEDYANWDFTEDRWYEKYIWTEAEQNDFQIWLGKFLTNHKYTSKRKYRNQDHGYYEAGKFILDYGWKATYGPPPQDTLSAPQR